MSQEAGKSWCCSEELAASGGAFFSVTCLCSAGSVMGSVVAMTEPRDPVRSEVERLLWQSFETVWSAHERLGLCLLQDLEP